MTTLYLVDANGAVAGALVSGQSTVPADGSEIPVAVSGYALDRAFVSVLGPWPFPVLLKAVSPSGFSVGGKVGTVFQWMAIMVKKL